MKKVTSIFTVLALLILFSGMALADDAEFRLVVTRNDATIDGELHVDLEMRITAGEAERTLNAITVDVFYGSQLTKWGTAFPGTNWAFGSTQGYACTVDKTAGGFYRVLITGNAVGTTAEGDPPGWTVTTNWQRIVTLRWTINEATSVEITISDETDAASYFPNLHNNPQGNAINFVVTNQDLGDVSVPVELSSFTADATVSGVTLNWSTETETENFGFHVYRSLTEQGDYHQISSEIIHGAGSSAEVHNYSYIDQAIQPGTTYYYKLADISLNGNQSFHGPVMVAVKALPTEYKLDQNFPNPFNPETAISFSLKETGKVTLKIYNLQGQLVRTLVDQEKTVGFYSVMWNGTDDSGAQLSTGVYYYTLKVNEYEQTKKLIFMK